jgi:hypothetical protein
MAMAIYAFRLFFARGNFAGHELSHCDAAQALLLSALLKRELF